MFEAAALLQGFLFLGARRRVWAWYVVLCAAIWVHHAFLSEAYNAYEDFCSGLQPFLPRGFMIEFYAMCLLIELAALGAVVAFFMPPLPPKANVDQGSSDR